MGSIRSLGSVVMMVQLSSLRPPGWCHTFHNPAKVKVSYRVSEADLARATERLQAHLEEQPRVPVVVPIIISPTKKVR
jgi:hypothetical protein